MGLNDKITDQYIEYNVDVLRVAEGTRDKVLTHLKLLEEDVKAQIHAADVAGVSRESAKVKRLNDLLRRVRETIDTAYNDTAGALQSELVDLADTTQQGYAGLIDDALNVNIARVAWTRQELVTIAKETNIVGAPAEAWWGKQAADTKLRFEQEIRLGVTAGETNDQIVDRIIGKPTGRRRVITIENEKAGKTKTVVRRVKDKDGRTVKQKVKVKVPKKTRRVVAERSGGVIETSKREATTLTRTAVQNVSNKVNKDVIDANSDILKGQRLVVTLDNRTSEICIARSGAMWDMEGNPLPDSPRQEPFPGHPPFHMNCRSVLVPMTKSWAELAEQFGNGERISPLSKLAALDDMPASTRASMDGQVPADLTYEGWLKTKSEAFQKDVLGAGKHALWKDGKITLAQLVDVSGRPMSVAQLRDKDTRKRLKKLSKD